MHGKKTYECNKDELTFSILSINNFTIIQIYSSFITISILFQQILDKCGGKIFHID